MKASGYNNQYDLRDLRYLNGGLFIYIKGGIEMYRKTQEEVLKELDSNVNYGLSTYEFEQRLEKYGANELTAKKKQSIFVRFLLQFKDVLIIILLIAAVLSLIVSKAEDWVDSLIIFVVVLLNACLGVYQEKKAEDSLEALKKMSSPECKVQRDGKTFMTPSSKIVPGDIIVVEAGDYVPADARIIESSNLSIDESALTGESVPSEKNTDVILDEVSLGDQKNMLFSSTFATYGRCKAVVTATGMNTEIGRIAKSLDTEDTLTPLQHKLEEIGKIIGFICIGICLVVFIMEFLADKSNPLAAFETAVALAVAAIPEGLATVVTIILSIGVSKMAREKAIVKKLPAVETLGSTNVVCSDKTGTLTQNKMTVVRAYLNGYVDLENPSQEAKKMISYFALCSDAKVSIVNGERKEVGDPTEIALIDANEKYGLDISSMKRVGDIPFDSDRKLMTVVVFDGKKYYSITKGAFDVISSRSKNCDVANINKEMATNALRVLGLSVKTFDEIPQIDSSLEDDLYFVGLIGMIDPERDEVKDSIRIAQEAGVKVVMITGDHIVTAKAIAKNLGIFGPNDLAISSDELHKMSDDELYEKIERFSVYARVNPEDKVRIVEMWQKHGKVVAMTGDGVNDSPALKKADIGCAMGITGTDVAKESADMILVDDNFSTIIKAVENGRGIYDNIKKCVRYLLSSNIGEVVTIFVASLLSTIGMSSIGVPLLPIHLLWINLITDSLPAFGLGMEDTEEGVMKEKPRDKKESLFAHGLGIKIAIEGIIVGGLTLIAYLIGHEFDVSLGASDYITGHTMAFVTLSLCELFHAYNVKTKGTIFNKNIFKNKFLNFAFLIGFLLQIGLVYIPGVNDIFKLQTLNLWQFATCIGLSISVIVLMEIYKLIERLCKKN